MRDINSRIASFKRQWRASWKRIAAVCASRRNTRLTTRSVQNTSDYFQPPSDATRSGSTTQPIDTFFLEQNHSTRSSPPVPQRMEWHDDHNKEQDDKDCLVAINRLLADLVACQDGSLFGITAAPINENVFEWSAIVFGPKNTPWEGGRFQFMLYFPDNYPFKPPLVQCLTPIFHPNISPESGIVALGSGTPEGSGLSDSWTPAWSASAILISVQAMLNNPNLHLSLDPVATHIYKTDLPTYYHRVRTLVIEGSKTDPSRSICLWS